MKEKQYVAEIPVKGHVLFIEKRCLIDEQAPYFKKDICVAIGKAVEKIIEENNLEISQIVSFHHGPLSWEFAEQVILEVRIFDIEIKTKDGNLYLLKEYTYLGF